MKLFDSIRSLWSKPAQPQTQTRSYYPNTLKPFGQLSQSILGIQAHISGKKPLVAHDVAARQANYYLRTNGAITTFVREIINNSVGTTLGTLQSKITALSPEENQRLNSKIETAWYDFVTKPENFDLSGRFDITEFLGLAVTNLLIEGEVNIRTFKGGKYFNKYQLLDFMSLDYNKTIGNTFNGVSLDGFTAPISYWIVDSNEQRFEIPAQEFIHFGNYLSVSDYRGTSYLVPAFDTLDKISAFESATVNAAINEATKVIYYSADSSYMKAYDGAASASDIAGFNPNAVQSSDTMTPSGYDPMAVLQGTGIQAGAIAVESLPAGVKLEQLQSNHPGNNFVEADKHLYKILGGALGMPSILMDLSDANYSSMRAGEIFKRPIFRKISRTLINKILSVMFENFMNGFIQANKKDFPKIDGGYEAYKQPKWPLPKFAYINPVDDVNSTILAIENDLLLWSEAVEMEGWDFEDFLKQKTLDEQMISASGTSLRSKQDKELQLEYYKVKNSTPAPAVNPVKAKSAAKVSK